MAFKNIIGQERAISMLQGILKRKRLAGSYLFCGRDWNRQENDSDTFPLKRELFEDRQQLT